MSNEVATVRVSLAERSYDIQIGEGLLDQAIDFVAARGGARHVVVITDANVDELYGDALADRFVDAGVESHVLVVEAGETSKSTDVVADLWQTMLDEGCDRQTVVVAVGGGVVGDIAGFVAATFARGLRFFQVPTTLLAQVDSSVGGKTGVNLEGAKNMVGAFWQPDGVLIDTAVLKTLPKREFAAGLAEVVKYGVILDAEFFAYLEANADAIVARDPAVLREIIQRSCRLKADVVEADEREETGLRAKLNYGHTLATPSKRRPITPSCCTAKGWRSGWCARRGWRRAWAGSTPKRPNVRRNCYRSLGCLQRSPRGSTLVSSPP
jgi:3-dehydroquinate synthase